MTIYTTVTAAALLGCAPRTLRRWCAYLDMEKPGHDYILDDADLQRIRAYLQPGPGNPNWIKDKK